MQNVRYTLKADSAVQHLRQLFSLAERDTVMANFISKIA